jgi:peptidoglycan hydrolase-like protein with peptidoglycan-binding domain
MRRSPAALAAILALATAAALGWGISPAAAQESFSGWRGGPIREGSGFRFPGGSDRVREVQRHLRTLGYSLSGEDGKFGAQTDQAVRRFQRREGLTANGVVGVRTIHALRAEVAAAERRARRGERTGGASTPRAGGDPAPARERATPERATPRVQEPVAGAREPRSSGETAAAEPAGTGIVLGVALVLAALAVGAALIVGRRLRAGGGARGGEAPSEDPTAHALSERIAAMRASGLSPQAVAERLRAERETDDA